MSTVKCQCSWEAAFFHTVTSQHTYHPNSGDVGRLSCHTQFCSAFIFSYCLRHRHYNCASFKTAFCGTDEYFHLCRARMPSVLWRCWLGGRKGIRPVKTEWWGAGMVICLEQFADLHMAQLMPLPLTVSCFSKIQIGFTFLVPAYPGSPGQRAVKWLCVCVDRGWLHKVWRFGERPWGFGWHSRNTEQTRW